MLWQKSPQYQNMPQGEYMKTAEGQQFQQASQQWSQWAKQAASRPGGQPQGGFSASSPGAAQPKPQAMGTAYNPSAGQPFSAWSQKPANAPDTWRPNGMRDNMARPQGMQTMGGGFDDPRWSQNGGQWPSEAASQPQAPPQVTNWMQSQAGQVFGGGPTMPPDVRQAYDQWYSSANKGTYSGSNAFAPGGTWESGPVPGTTMYRPPVNDSPYGRPMGDALPPPPGAFGGQPQAGRPPAQPGQRTPITRPTPGKAPGQVSSYPAALPPSSQPYYDEVMKQFPGMSPFDAADMANRVRSQQEQQLRDVTNPVKPMPAARTPEQIASGQQQQRQREQAQERQRQKARRTQARNDRMR